MLGTTTVLVQPKCTGSASLGGRSAPAGAFQPAQGGSRGLALSESDSDEEVSHGARRLPLLEPTQLRRAIGPQSALAIRGKAVTRAVRVAAAEGDAAPPSPERFFPH